MPSFQDLCEETLGLLTDWTGEQAQMCSLTAPMSAVDLTLTVDDVERLGSRGLVEVDEELVYVSSVDQSSGIATVPAWGRAQLTSAAAAHAPGARVTTAPRPPRVRVKKSISAVVTGLYPDLWSVTPVEQPATLASEYPLPAGARWVINVTWETPTSPSTWERVRYWRLNTGANPADFPTGVSVTVSPVPVGQTIRVLYAGEPQPMVDPTDDFAAVTGLHEGVADLVVMAAASRLVLSPDLSRSQLSTLEQSERNTVVPASAGLTASRFLDQQYGKRVAAERRRLLAAHPTRPHYEGV